MPNIAPSEPKSIIAREEEKSFCSRKVQPVRNHEERDLAVAACSSPTPLGAIGEESNDFICRPSVGGDPQITREAGTSGMGDND